VKKVSKEFYIGAVVILSIAILFTGINYLKGINLFKDQNRFFAVYDNVDLLTASNPIVLNGFKIGLVEEVILHPDGSGKLLVSMIISDKNLKIPADTRAKIHTSDFFGSKAIKFELGESQDFALPGDTLESAIEEDLTTAIRRELEPLRRKTAEMLSGIEEIVDNLNLVFKDDATQGLPKAFKSLQRSMEILEGTSLKLDMMVQENREKLKSIFGNIDSIMENLENNNEALTNVFENFESISDSLAQINFKETMMKAGVALESVASIMEKIDRGEGTLGMLVNSDSLHVSLENTSQELQYLLNDIYDNPWRYIHVSIFGKKEKKRFSKKELQQIEDLFENMQEEPNSP
jgi:phospholipid/cholesterol/gamma-HCH transport system substrate-binding protein